MQAKTEAASDPVTAARVEWLTKGLMQASLLLATEKGYEKSIDTGDKSAFNEAYSALKAFREQNAEYDKANYAGLKGDEKIWAKNAE